MMNLRCKACQKPNELDQWFEAPKLRYLVCPSCASKIEYSRPIHINTIADRLLESYEALEKLAKERDELQRLHDDSPDLAKQLRRLVRAVEKNGEAAEKSAELLGMLVDNLSPRWVFSAPEHQKEPLKNLLRRMAEDARPGALLEVSEEEQKLLQQVTRL